MPLTPRRLVVALACAWAPTVVFADTPAALSDIDVTETGTPATQGYLPSSSESVDAAELLDLNVFNTEDAVKYAPNMEIRKRYIGDRNSNIAVRSTSAWQTARGLVYGDGLLLSNFLNSDFPFSPRWDMVSPREIERVDVIYGPYSALYPGNSLGATVLITTRMPEKFEGNVHAQVFTQSFDLYGNKDSYNGHSLDATVGSRAGALSWLLGAQRLDNRSQPLSYSTSGVSTTAALPADTVVTGAAFDRGVDDQPRVAFGYNGEGVDHTVQDLMRLRLGYDFAPDLKAQFSVNYWQQARDSSTRSFLRDALGNTVTSGNVSIGGMQYVIPANTFAESDGEDARWLYGASLKGSRAGWNWEAVASLFDISKSVSRSANQAGNGPGSVTYGDGTGWWNLDLRADRPRTADLGHRVSFGYHFDNYEIDNTSYDTTDWRSASAPVFNNAFSGQTETHAVYLQDAWQFAERWQLTLGARYENWRAFDGSRTAGGTTLGYPERSESHTSPKAALEYQFDSPWIARLSLGKAWRFPTVGEMFQGQISGLTLVNNDPNLKPEEAFSKELTFERSVGGSHLRLSVYEDDVRDVIHRQVNTLVFPMVYNIQNIDRVRTRGAEVAWEGKDIAIKGLDLSASLAFNDPEILRNTNDPASVGKRFYYIADWRASLIATWHQNETLDYTAALRHSGKQNNDPFGGNANDQTFGAASSYTVLDAKVNWNVNREARLSFGVDNLTNQYYYWYHPYPARTFYLEGNYSF